MLDNVHFVIEKKLHSHVLYKVQYTNGEKNKTEVLTDNNTYLKKWSKNVITLF